MSGRATESHSFDPELRRLADAVSGARERIDKATAELQLEAGLLRSDTTRFCAAVDAALKRRHRATATARPAIQDLVNDRRRTMALVVGTLSAFRLRSLRVILAILWFRTRWWLAAAAVLFLLYLYRDGIIGFGMRMIDGIRPAAITLPAGSDAGFTPRAPPAGRP